MADLVLNGEEVGGLAVECVAEGGEGGETDCASAAVLEDREVDDGDVHLLGELRERQPALLEQPIEMNGDPVRRRLRRHR